MTSHSKVAAIAGSVHFGADCQTFPLSKIFSVSSLYTVFNMRIIVKKLDGWTEQITVSDSASLDQVRQKIFEILPEKDVLPGQVQLIFQGKSVEQGRLRDLGLQDGSVLMIVIKAKIKITVVVEKKRIPLEVEASETVENVKMMVSNQKGCSTDEMTLFFNQQPLKEGRLSHYKVSQGSTLELRFRVIQIFLYDPEGKTHTFDVRTSDTVDDFKKLVHHKTHVVPDQQVLSFAGKTIPAGQGQIRHTLGYYSIREHSTIHMSLRLRGG